MLSSTGLADVTATVSQDKTEWSYSEILPDSKTIGNGTIDASGISAGAWEGSFWFNINLEESGSETPVVLEAGLYDADDVMLCSWEESGIDVETDYTSSTYKTNTSSPYYIITNNYPTTVKVVLPDSVTSISDYTFTNCTSLTSIEIPDGVTSIGISAFNYCTNLTSVTIPDGVISIGRWAFNYCTNLTSIKIPDSVISISDQAFAYCKNLTSVEISDSITSISGNMFDNCTGLTSVTIPDSVTNIEYNVFKNCTALTTINYAGTQEQWNAITKGLNWNYNCPANMQIIYNYTE